jgi:hypothetical protein
VISRLSRFFGLPVREWGLVVEAALSLLVVRLLAVLPFRWALRLMRITQGGSGSGRVVALDAEAIGRAIGRAAGAVPFRAVCVHEAFAALLMLRRRGLSAIVRLGLSRDSGALIAHAWCRCGDVPVTGEEAAPRFVAVATFSA